MLAFVMCVMSGCGEQEERLDRAQEQAADAQDAAEEAVEQSNVQTNHLEEQIKQFGEE